MLFFTSSLRDFVLRRSIVRFAIVLFSITITIASGSLHAQVTSTWNGGVGLWGDAIQWSTGAFPNNGNGGNDYDALFSSGTSTLDLQVTIDSLTFSGGTIGGDYDLDIVSAPLDWSGGRFENDLYVIANAGVELTGGNHDLISATLINTDYAEWDSGDIRTGTGSEINNAANATFDAKSDVSMINAFGGIPSNFNNLGTFVKSGGNGDTQFSIVAFNNTGTVNADSGIIWMRGGGVSTGVWNVNAGRIEFGGGTHELNAGTVVSGDGVVEVSGGTTNFNDGVYDLDGATWLVGGNLNVNADAFTNAFDFASGLSSIGGTGTLNVTGPMTWSAGRIAGGTVQSELLAELSGGTFDLVAGTFNNTGDAQWMSGDFRTGSDSAINNNGFFEALDDGAISNVFGGTPSSFNNEGAFTKSGGSGTTGFSNVVFNNSGDAKSNSGNLSFFEYHQTAGTLFLGGGDVTMNSNSPMDIQGGEIRGAGTIFGDVDNVGGTIRPGDSIGQITIDGDAMFSVPSRLVIEIDGVLPSQFDQLNATGTAAIDGELSIEVDTGYSPQVGDSFEIVSASSVSGTFENLILAPIQGNLFWSVRYEPTRVVVFVDTATVPDSFVVSRGNYVSGDAASLAQSDNTDLVARRRNTDVQSIVQLDVKSFSTVASPTSLSVTVEGSVFARTTVNQVIELYDYVAQDWEQVDLREATRFVDSSVTIAANGDLTRFVEPGTLCIEARVRYQSPNPRQQFAANVDQIVWSIN